MSYEIGRIANTHGLKGEIKVKSDSDFNRFIVGKNIYVLKNDERIEFSIKSVRQSNQGLIVKFDGIDDINNIEHLKGQSLFTDEAPELGEDEYHFQDLIGLKVFNKDLIEIGVVEDILDVPQGQIIKVKTESKMVMIPFVSAFVKEVTDEAIYIEEIEGLL